MRKYHLQQIKKILQTLAEANKELCRLTSQETYTTLLSDCQDCTLALNKNIERLAGQGTETSLLLVEYVNMLYSAYQLGVGSALNSVSLLNQQLNNIDRKIKAELKADRIEIVFFPYQLSMWDSLESVYLAAKADPNCDAFCVPIPWYERLSDGQNGTMHYDGDRYPANVEVTDWQNYHVEDRHPDVIVVHCPYDDTNFVTTVHPDYYCAYLHKFTDCLVYIPYFVMGDNLQDHFVTLPGSIYSDKVFLETEKVRNLYIKKYKRDLGSRYGRPENKFVALGSPKYDKVLMTKREDCGIPEVWDKIITKIDGSKKTVVLYNTSISSILAQDKQYLYKLRFVLDTFKNCEDIVLWWRPHPLSELTYNSMRISLAEEYGKIIENYKSEGYGIYDDTPDLHRAIAWSDVYFGDGSSVVHLYKSTGKPIMIQNVKYPELDSINYFHLAHAIYNGKRYSLLFSRNVIIETELRTLKSRYYGYIPNKNYVTSNRPYHRIYTYKDNLVFIPFDESDLVIHNLTDHNWKFVDLDLKPELMGQKGHFMYAHISGDKIVLSPRDYREIVVYDFISGEVQHCCDLTGIFPINGVRPGLLPQCTIGKNRILMLSATSNKIIDFSIDHNTFRALNIGNGKDIFNSMLDLGNGRYLLVGRNHAKVVIWEYATNHIVKEYNNFPSNFEGLHNWNKSKTLFCESKIPIVFGNCLYLFPARANMAVKFDIITHKIEEITALTEYCRWDNPKVDLSLVDGIEFDGSKVYLNNRSEYLLEYNLETEEIRCVPFRPDWAEGEIKILNERFLNVLAKKEFLFEDHRCITEIREQAGQRIFEYIKSYL